MNGSLQKSTLGLRQTACKLTFLFEEKSSVMNDSKKLSGLDIGTDRSNAIQCMPAICFLCKRFPGVVDAINFSSAPIFIITTKQTRFCLLLLERYGVSKISENNVYGLGSGSKISVLKQLLRKPECQGKKICFVEDRYETLEAVSLSMLGQPLELYLASWGYNTPNSRTTAERHPFINLIDLPTFVNRMQ